MTYSYKWFRRVHFKLNNMRNTRNYNFGILLIWVLASSKFCLAAACSERTPTEYDSLTRYIGLKYHLPQEAHLRIETHEVVNDACYRRIIFKGDGALGSYQLTVFASPDLRFASSDLLDSQVDPEKEQRQAAQKALDKLLDGEFASRGPRDAKVTLVVFSDFECPFCKQFSRVLAEEPLLGDGGKVQLVFRHMPLSGHPWAAKAAKAAACAEFQSRDAFWSLHDSLFENQGSITVDNASKQIFELASGIKALNIETFRKCVDQDMSLGVVLRDEELAHQMGVRGTPTIFLDGEQLPRALDRSSLHRAIIGALGQGTVGTERTSEPINSGSPN